jgi:hypothetical protein
MSFPRPGARTFLSAARLDREQLEVLVRYIDE